MTKLLKLATNYSTLIKLAERCNCENSACKHGKDNKVCSNQAGSREMMYVGPVCDECAKNSDPKYMKPNYTLEQLEDAYDYLSDKIENYPEYDDENDQWITERPTKLIKQREHIAKLMNELRNDRMAQRRSEPSPPKRGEPYAHDGDFGFGNTTHYSNKELN